MPKCKIKECNNLTRYKNTTNQYCSMHLTRIKRNGNPELKIGSHALEKLPHEVVDDFILENQDKMIDIEIANCLKKLGFEGANQWTVKYRRRRLGIKKYLHGEILKHRIWIRSQAIKKYGNKCELCEYRLSIDVHHITPRHKGGLHEVDNLMILCPNCHALITRKIFILDTRNDIPKIQLEIKQLLKNS